MEQLADAGQLRTLAQVACASTHIVDLVHQAYDGSSPTTLACSIRRFQVACFVEAYDWAFQLKPRWKTRVPQATVLACAHLNQWLILDLMHASNPHTDLPYIEHRFVLAAFCHTPGPGTLHSSTIIHGMWAEDNLRPLELIEQDKSSWWTLLWHQLQALSTAVQVSSVAWMHMLDLLP